jgi:hypothetical protein
VDEFKINITPDFVCFHGQRCSTLLRDLISIKIIDGLTCYSVFNLIETHTIKDFDELEKYFFNLSERCLKSGIDKSEMVELIVFIVKMNYLMLVN